MKQPDKATWVITEMARCFAIQDPQRELIAYTHWRAEGDEYGLSREQALALAYKLACSPVLLVLARQIQAA